jgi:DHA3 family macrolide efflux protein-like MFS transporter
MQTTIAQEKQGRAFSVFYSALCLTVPIGLMIAGPVAEALGARMLFIFSGALGIFTMLICLNKKMFSGGFLSASRHFGQGLR